MTATHLTTAQELALRKKVAPNLRGIPARQNAASIDMLEIRLLLEELHASIGKEELDRFDRQESTSMLELMNQLS